MSADKTASRNARKQQILDAAEACFVRNGFHRTTMADIAREAAMSQGNFYRYYTSKEAIIEDLATRENARGAELVAGIEAASNRHQAILALFTRYFAVPRERAVLRLDVWAEATRNETIATRVRLNWEGFREWVLEGLRELGHDRDCEATWAEMSTILKGMIVNRALSDSYDPDPDLVRLDRLIQPRRYKHTVEDR